MSKSKLDLLLERAKIMAQSIEEPRARDSWSCADIDAIGEAALILYEKGLNIIDPGSPIDHVWESLFCKIYSSLLYWRGEFKACWSVCERLCRLENEHGAPHSQAVALARAAGAASHYARYQAPNSIRLDAACLRAEKYFAKALALANGLAASDETFCGMTPQSYVMYEAARHWFHFDSKALAGLLLAKASTLTPYACYRSAQAHEAPQFWKDLYSNRAWLAFAKKIIDQTHISNSDGYEDIFE